LSASGVAFSVNRPHITATVGEHGDWLLGA
jgi:hypothetical protein